MKKSFIILLGIILIFGCASIYDIKNIENKENYGNEFDKYMQKGYIKLAKFAENTGDWDAVETFVRRARWASNGETPNISPFNLEKINKNHQKFIKSSYQRIDRAFSFGAKIKNKINAASAQISYECMYYFGKNDIITPEFSDCRKDFEIAMRPFEVRDENNNTVTNEQENFLLKEDIVNLPNVQDSSKNILELLEERIQNNKASILPKEISETVHMNKNIEISRKSFVVTNSFASSQNDSDFNFQNGKYIIYFKFNRSDISSYGLRFVKEIAENYQEINPSSVNITGHTDTMGSKKVNQIISVRRAKVVANALKNQGIPENKMIVKGMGEAMLAVSTPDATKERKNRRTEIKFE